MGFVSDSRQAFFDLAQEQSEKELPEESVRSTETKEDKENSSQVANADSPAQEQ